MDCGESWPAATCSAAEATGKAERSAVAKRQGRRILAGRDGSGTGLMGRAKSMLRADPGTNLLFLSRPKAAGCTQGPQPVSPVGYTIRARGPRVRTNEHGALALPGGPWRGGPDPSAESVT